ncbi:MerR family transcriptional regulator [Glutamicibacter endophyticus]|uniref:MerR family transcriptional regulator n=1 Tax=Glutamicibacter endophyticus TaxID=1522174 RepID=UPI003AF1976D
MLSIGAFAQIGQVTHRMLRHWDTAGLLVPAHVDRFTGYRSYDPSQLARLHRIVALRQLGFGLEDIALILQQGVDAERLTELLQLRHDEVEREYQTAAARLRDVQRRLHLIERENAMSTIEIVEKSLPALRLLGARHTVNEQPEVGAVVGPLFHRVEATLEGTDLGMPIAQYEATENGLHICVGYELEIPVPEGLEEIQLPAEATAICGVHLGSMDRIAESWQSIHAQLIARGLVPSGPCRELYVRSDSADQQDWVTELQQPVRRADSMEG